MARAGDNDEAAPEGAKRTPEDAESGEGREKDARTAARRRATQTGAATSRRDTSPQRVSSR